MALLRRLASVFSTRNDGDEAPPPDDDFWYTTPTRSHGSGVDVSPESAVGTTAVYACVQAIAQIIGSLPLITYERDQRGGRSRASDSPYYKLFQVTPNGWMTPGEWVEQIFVHLLLKGNAYQFKLKDRARKVVALSPLFPDQMVVDQNRDGTLSYEYTFKDGKKRRFTPDEIMHFRTGFSDGITGRSPITVARESVGLTIAAELYAGRFFSNSAMTPGVLQHPGELNDEQFDRIKKSWHDTGTGPDNAWKVRILEEGMTYQPIALSSEDAQFVEQRRFQLEEVARLFRVPPHVVGDLSRATFSNIEHQGINFVVYSLMPYMRRFEETLVLNFFQTKVNNRELYSEFLVDSLLRGDTISRQQSFQIMRQNGVLTANEWRRYENLSPTPDKSGDRFLVPVNLIWADELQASGADDEPANDPQTDAPGAGEDDSEDQARALELRDAARAVFADILTRLVYKEEQRLQKIENAQQREEKETEFFSAHQKIVKEALEPAANLYREQLRFVYRKKPLPLEETFLAFWHRYIMTVGEGSTRRVLELSEALCKILERGSHYVNGEANETGTVFSDSPTC